MTDYTVSSGSTSASITLSSGDTMTVDSGGTAVSTTILGGGVQYDSGTAIDTQIAAGGVEGVYDGGVASDTTVAGVQYVFSGLASGTTVESGGIQLVGYAGTTIDTTIQDGGFEIVSAGVASDTTVDSGGTLIVLRGSAPDTTSDGGANVASTGVIVVSSLHVISGPVPSLSGTDLVSGDVEYVLSGGSVSATTIENGANQYDYGTASGTNVSAGGYQYVYNAASGTEIDGGAQYLYSGGVANHTTISAGGIQVAYFDGVADNTTIDSDAAQYLYFFGTASGTTIDNGGDQYVYSGGFANGTNVVAGGTEFVGFGGTASDTTLFAGGFEIVSSGGVVSDTAISGGTLDVQSGGIVSGTVTFGGHSGTLQIDGPGSGGTPLIDGASIVGFVSGNTIDLTGVPFTSGTTTEKFASSGDGGVLNIYQGVTLAASLDFTGTYHTGDFTLASDPGGTDITTDVPCYCRGTLIQTERGEVAVEELAIGDRVATLSGAARPIKWIGRRSYSGRFVAGNRDVLPIAVKAGALGDGVPQRDLLLSPEHALYLDGGLVPARHLVNGVSIVQVTAVETVEYFHIELDRHDVIFAEGAAAESFIDDDSRMMFHNAGEFYARYPQAVPLPARYCAPRIEDGAALEAVRRRLLGRARRLGIDGTAAPARLRGNVGDASHARIAGWAFDPARPEAAVTLVVVANGAVVARAVADRYRRDLERSGIGDGRHGFEVALPQGLARDRRHEIELYGEAGWIPLLDAPAVLEPVAAAQ